MKLIVTPNGRHEALLAWGGAARRAAIGRSGIGDKRVEGDGVTPAGHFVLRTVLYRGDRIPRPATRLPTTQIAPEDGWCNAPGDPAYNRPVKLPYRASAESLWREDHLYDLVIVLGFNDAPVVSGAGSAIFLHVARPLYDPTDGCVALSLDDLVQILPLLGPGDAISIRA